MIPDLIVWYFLYYRKLDESSAKQYFRITDVYSNCDAVIYNGFALANCFMNAINKTTSHCLYYRKLDESIAKQYFRITDVYSNCDVVIYNGFALANCFMNAINKTTSHSLY